MQISYLIIENTNWEKLETLMGSTFDASNTYTIFNNGVGSLRLADLSSAPTNDLNGVVIGPGVQVTYEKGTGDLYIKKIRDHVEISINSNE